MTNKKMPFETLINRFYASGVLKEVYSSETATVCNVFNQFYLGFSKELVEKYDGRFPAFMMNSTGLKNVVEDGTFINKYLSGLSSEEQDRVLVMVDEHLLEHFIAHKAEFSAKLPADDMDLAFEQQLIASKSKQRELASMLDEKQAQSLAAAQQKGVPSQK